jgi:mono/diheme cytochrome c family protein
MNARVLLVLGIGLGCGGDDEDETTTQSPVERGQYLVNNVAACIDCHTPRDETGQFIPTMFLAGAPCFAELPNGSCLNTRNLTNHETGLANRTDAEIKRMIRDGVRPAVTGDEPLSPVMPYYVFHNISDADLDAIVAYLRTVPGVDNAIGPSGPEFDVPAAATPLDPSLIPMPTAGYVDTPAALRGRYLAGEVGICLECHTTHVMGNPNVLDYAGIFAGGERFDIGLPTVPISKNLTSDAETGLGNWSIEQITNAIRLGSDREGAGICPPMPVGPMGAFGGLTDSDVQDIAHYLKSLPPIVNAIDDVCTFPPM